MRILVIRFSSLGDIVLSTTFIHSLKEIYSNAFVTYITKCKYKDVIEDNPYIDRVVCLEENESIISLANKVGKEKFDIVFDLHSSLRSKMFSLLIKKRQYLHVCKYTLFRLSLIKKNRFLRLLSTKKPLGGVIEWQLSLLGVQNKGSFPHLFVDKDTENNVSEMMGTHFKNRFLVGFAADSSWKTKMWGVDKYSALAEKILSWNKNAVLFLFGENKEIGGRIEIVCPHRTYNLMGRLTIKEAIALISFMNIFVSNDSGLMHIANAFRIPLVVIFGPTVSEFGFYPRGKEVRVAEVDMPCRPCSLHGTDVCKKDYQCMKMISVDDVFDKVKEVSQYANQRTRSSISSYK